MRLRAAILALGLAACTPTGEIDVQPEIDALENPPSVASVVHVETPTQLAWPGCTQEFPSPFGEQDEPFVWQTAYNEDANHACRYGCTARTASRTSAAPGIVVAILDDGSVRVATSAWEVRLQAEGILARHVQWTSWCGDEAALAIHDGRTLRLVAIGTASGEIVEDIELPIDTNGPNGGLDPAFAMQMHCRDRRTEVHARGHAGAWRTSLPSHGTPLQRVPDDVWAEIVAKPYGHEAREQEREEYTTATRRFHRKGHELFAFDRAGLPLWHRKTIHAKVGCLDEQQHWGLLGCSRCPTPMQGVTLVGEHVMLEDHDLRSSIDVFDEDGAHVVHLQLD